LRSYDERGRKKAGRKREGRSREKKKGEGATSRRKGAAQNTSVSHPLSYAIMQGCKDMKKNVLKTRVGSANGPKKRVRKLVEERGGEKKEIASIHQSSYLEVGKTKRKSVRGRED